MNTVVISRDRDLYRLCRDILGEVTKENSQVLLVQPGETLSPADLYLWDFEVESSSLSDIPQERATTHLFLVNRKDLPVFRSQCDTSNILLKPVTKATLSAFLGLAVTAHAHRLSATSSLKAERDEILQCLIQTNLKLQEYDQDRTAFLARALHDFRAPLTALSGYCGILLSEALGPLGQDQRQVVQRMLRSARRLSRMSAAMFQLSVGKQVKRRPDLKPADLQVCLDQALHEVSPVADDKSISIATDLAPCGSPLFFEAGQIEQVLVNILDNACKFTPKHGSIQVSGQPHFWERRSGAATVPVERRRANLRVPNAYRVDICNSGPLIPPEHLGRIFEEYTSYTGGRDRSGGGLGLAICRMIVNEHAGIVWAENTQAGPMISFVVPLRPESIRATETHVGGSMTLAEAG